MVVDKRRAGADSGPVLLGHAIKASLDGRPQRWLADALDLDPGVVTRLIQGQVKDVTLERVREIEDVLELPAGALLRAAGYVEDAQTPEAAIAADVSLPRILRTGLIAAIEAGRGSR